MNAIEDQLKSEEAPYVREHYIRLIEMGFSEVEAKKMLGAVLTNEMWELGQAQKEFDEATYIEKLENLPDMPWKEDDENSTVVKEKKVGRNDPCFCGSGKKFKKCCGKN